MVKTLIDELDIIHFLIVVYKDILYTIGAVFTPSTYIDEKKPKNETRKYKIFEKIFSNGIKNRITKRWRFVMR